ncbi:hypothetical protein D4764_21G0005300 [Takifugu flavidus]|uniref:Uncharacterized protein n=1 Tax=Takifugu flavidus TaxID=433684 RepID=A0A5C6NHW9_9TELE|nr:hypothetical protein D4764_21G0005300 [Takifugu flavidus]
MALATLSISLITLALSSVHLSRGSNRHAVYWNSSNILGHGPGHRCGRLRTDNSVPPAHVQARRAGGACRRGVQEGRAGGACRRGVQVWRAGVACRRGVQEGPSGVTLPVC